MIRVSYGNDVDRGVVSSEGKMTSFVNYAYLLIKTFNTSIDFISQRAAYDLGSVGGIEGSEVQIWDATSPTIDTLTQQLESRIKENLPQGTTEGGISIMWGDASISVSDCTDSKCFLVSGGKTFSIYEKAIDSRISMNPFKINSKISSSYFRLLYVGRQIFENTKYYTNLIVSDPAKLAQLKTDWENDFGITASITAVEGQIDVLLEDKSCDLINDFYCIAPLKPGETGEISEVPYDYLKLKFRVGSATSFCDGTIALGCTVPDLQHANDERLWGDASCGRVNAKIDCDSVSGSNKVCNINNFCEKIQPTINYYAVSTQSVNVGGSFSISVNSINSNCPAGLPGKCLIECRVIHPDGHWIEIDSWDEAGTVTMPSVKCNQIGDYIVDYCGIFTDFFIDSGWGNYDITKTTINCS
jgi:hypothetical protein